MTPMTATEFDRLKQSVLFTDDDVRWLRRSREVLAGQTDAVLDVWYGFVAQHPFLVHYFGRKSDGQPDARYLEAVRKRFAQWILDTAAAEYDERWLALQHEIGLRHHRAKKNRTDEVDSVDVVHFRYLNAFIYPITATLEPFLRTAGDPPDAVGKMHQAWLKSVILQVTLWARPYVRDEDY